MPQPPVLYDTLLALFRQAPWRDERHLKTLCWMVAGLLSSGWIALDAWVPHVAGRAEYAQSTVRRSGAGCRTAGSTRCGCMWRWTRRCCGACSAWCRCRWCGAGGRCPLPLAWKVLRHNSASVAFRNYCGVPGFAARLLKGREVVLLADRGFIHAELLRWAGKAGWHYRIRTPCATMACASPSKRAFWTPSQAASSGSPQGCATPRRCSGCAW